jgi:hypothetical protein
MPVATHAAAKATSNGSDAAGDMAYLPGSLANAVIAAVALPQPA